MEKSERLTVQCAICDSQFDLGLDMIEISLNLFGELYCPDCISEGNLHTLINSAMVRLNVTEIRIVHAGPVH